MCGLIGYIELDKGKSPSAAIAAVSCLTHRGPDDAGFVTGKTLASTPRPERPVSNLNGHWVFQPGGEAPQKCCVFLGHTRFALVDLSPGGAQPMISPDGQVALTFNGEIYNHNELRRELQAKGHHFASTSDTEVLLQSYLAWGENCFARFRGFWALTIWDTRRKGVLLCRDRLGKAPLYIHSSSSGVRWASEIAALFVLESCIERKPDWTSINDFIRHGLRDAFGKTCFDGIQTLDAASYVWVDENGLGKKVRYWSLPQNRLSEKDISVEEAAKKVREELIIATDLRIHADVPVALQLSGGLDSSVVLACAAELGNKVKAVTVSFPQEEANEDIYARAAAGAFPGLVDHQFIRPGSTFSLDELMKFTRSMGEPVHSPNQMSNRAIWTELKALGYKAVLYGAAGDEVFAGYSNRYFVPYVQSAIMRGDFASAASTIVGLSERSLSPVDLLKRLMIVLPGAKRAFDWTTKSVASDDALYLPPPTQSRYQLPWQFNDRMKALMSDMQMNYWLRIDNQNSMAVPIELRAPFLDHNVVETAFSMPASYLVRDGWMKWIVRKAFERSLPKEVVWRRQKMGFPFPLNQWLTENRDWALGVLRNSQAPHILLENLARRYDATINRAPNQAWRVLSYATWWQSKKKLLEAAN